jgi:hypothetical protein
MDELLNNLSPDGLRVLSLDSYHRLREVERTWDESNVAGVPLPLGFLIEELKAYLSRDPVVTADFAIAWTSVLPRLNSAGDRPKEAIEAVRFLASALAPSYLRKCRSYIEKAVGQGRVRNRRAFRFVTENFCAYLLNAGYHPQSIHFRVRRTFFERDLDQTLLRELRSFFAAFPHDTMHRFAVGVAVSEDLSDLLSERPEFDRLTARSWPEGWNARRRLETAEPRMFVWKTDALDVVDARNRCEAHLSKVRAIAYTAKPYAKLNWATAIIVGEDGSPATILRDPVDPLRWGRGRMVAGPRDSSARLGLFLDRQWPEPDQNRVSNALNSYADAFHSESPSGQLLALWSSMEGLLPAPDGTGSRISAFSRDVIACLEHEAFRRQLTALHDDLNSTYRTDYLGILNRARFPATDHVSRLAAIFCLAENAPLQGEMGTLCANNPLARQRLFELYDASSSIGGIWRTIMGRSEKNTWHLHRIYRERNRIVHRASPSANVEGLILNLNAYILGVLDALLAVSADIGQHVRLDDMFAQLRIMQEARRQWAASHSADLLDAPTLAKLLRGHL